MPPTNESRIETLLSALARAQREGRLAAGLAEELAPLIRDLREALAQVEQVAQANVYLRDEIHADQRFTGLIGDSAAMQQVRAAILQVSRTDSTALILGETGTGKELIARAIHKISRRRQHLMVKVNCAALAPGVISELFGHEPGAFTGAPPHGGRFELVAAPFSSTDRRVPLDVQVLRVLREQLSNASVATRRSTSMSA